MPLRLDVIEDAKSLEELAPQWWALWGRVPAATPFQSPAWLIPWWRAFTPGRLLTLVVRSGDELIGLAPFYIGGDERARPLGVSSSDYFDVLIDPVSFEAAADILRRALRTLDAGPVEWEMTDVPPDAQAFALGADGLISKGETCPVLEIPPGAQGLSSILPARKRRKLSMARHRAERAGGAEIERASGVGLEAGLRALLGLHRLRWRDRGGGVLTDERVQRFHASALPQLDAAGMLDLLLCRIGGTIVAAYYGMHDHSRAYAYLGGFDPEHSFSSPCALLIGHAIEEAVRRGAREFHFLRGGEQYKYEWGAVDRVNGRIVVRGGAQNGSG